VEAIKVVILGKVLNVVEGEDYKQLQFLIQKDNGKFDFLNVKVPKNLDVKAGDEVKLQVAPGVFNNKLYYKFIKSLK
jgi:hypothetical protein